MKKEEFSPPKFQIPRVVHNFFPRVVTQTELISSAVATYEANEATASVKFAALVKI